jgi:hypothetical protein
MQEPLFMQAIEGFFLRSTGVGLSLTAADWQRLRDWRALHIPATVILDGIDAALRDRRAASPPHDLAFALPHIEQAILAYQAALLTTAPATSPPPVAAPVAAQRAAPQAPPAWAATLATSYDAVKASLIRLGQGASSDDVRAALRNSFRAVLAAERRKPPPSPVDLWKTARAIALQDLQRALPDPELSALRAQAEASAQPTHGALSLSPQALAARRDHQFERLLARRFGVEALLSLPRAEVS